MAEGLTLSEFNVGSYKTSDAPPGKAPAWTIVAAGVPDGRVPAFNEAVRRGRLLGECSNLARELANEPGNTLTPREFARRSEAIVAGKRSVVRGARRKSRSNGSAWACCLASRAAAASRRA